MKLAPRTRVTKGKLGGMSFMYNPTGFLDSQSVTYNEITTPAMSYPELIYGGGNTRQITFTIYLNDKVQNGITKKFISNLEKYLPPKRKNATSFKSPPPIRFAFGWLVEDCYLVSVEKQYLKFSPTLQPIEANVTVTLNVIQ